MVKVIRGSAPGDWLIDYHLREESSLIETRSAGR